jgi:ankyrin repeat protein
MFPPISRNRDSTQIYSNSLVFQAATLGDLSLLEACLDAGITLETKADDESTALDCAARAGQTAAVQYLLGKGAVFEVNGRTPLHEAILSYNTETVGLLLQHLSKTTLLSDVPNLEKCLAQSGNPDVVQLYVDHLDAAGERRDASQRILAAASLLGKSSMVTMLLERPDVNVNKKEKGIAPVHSAARYSHVELMKVILSHEGIDVNLTTRYEAKTPLLIAASKGKSEIIGLLLAQPSTEVNAATWYNKDTPLHMAAKKGHVDVAKLLVAHKAIDLNCLNWVRQTLLHVAAIYGHLDVTRLLLNQPNLDTRCRDVSQETALHHAAFNGHWEIVQSLLESSEPSDSSSYTRDLSPILGVTSNADLVQNLLDDPDFQDGHISGRGNSESSLLHGACKRGDCDTIRVLLAYEGINVNVPEHYGYTPLLLAVRNSHLEAVRLLLQYDGIDINQKAGFYNRTALFWAMNYSNQDMVDLLISHGATDDEANLPTTTGHVTNTPIATTPNNAPEPVPRLQPEPIWDDFMKDSPIEEWERSLDTELEMFDTDQRI